MAPKTKKISAPPAKPPRAPNIEWVKNPDWTWTLITYLNEHEEFRHKFFSDSTEGAKQEGRKKAVAKDGKTQQYAVLAKHIFEDDAAQKASYKENPGRYATSVETRLRRLKGDYQYYLKELGSTGAGLDPQTITPGSQIANIVDKIRDLWPWWDEFHGFWRQLPHYNPISVENSAPGVDHAANAAALFDPSSTTADKGAESTKDSDDPEGTGEGTAGEEHPGYDPRLAGADLPLDNEPMEDWFDVDQEETDEGKDKVTTSDDDHESEILDVTPPPSLRKFKSTPAPPPVPQTAPKKSKAPAGGRDLGLSKASKKTVTTNNKNPVDRFTEAREEDSRRTSEKNKRTHEYRMYKAETKRMRLQNDHTGATNSDAVRMEEVRVRREELRVEELRIKAEMARYTSHRHPSFSSSPVRGVGPSSPSSVLPPLSPVASTSNIGNKF